MNKELRRAMHVRVATKVYSSTLTPMHKPFALAVVKRWTDKANGGRQYWYLEGYASDTSVDRDGDRMSMNAIKAMKKYIDEGMNLFLDHNHELTNTLGLITKSEIRGDKLWIQARLEDPEINPMVKQIIHKMEIGEKVGFSIGGDMTKHYYEEDGRINKRVRVIDDVALYEISAVGLPSNANAYATGSMYKGYVWKSFDPRMQKGLSEHKMSCGACRDVHKEIKQLISETDKVLKGPYAGRQSGIGAGSMGYREDFNPQGIEVHGPSATETVVPKRQRPQEEDYNTQNVEIHGSNAAQTTTPKLQRPLEPQQLSLSVKRPSGKKGWKHAMRVGKVRKDTGYQNPTFEGQYGPRPSSNESENPSFEGQDNTASDGYYGNDPSGAMADVSSGDVVDVGTAETEPSSDQGIDQYGDRADDSTELSSETGTEGVDSPEWIDLALHYLESGQTVQAYKMLLRVRKHKSHSHAQK